MKLVHVDLEKPIAIHRNCPTEWIIESPELFLKYVEQLQKQNQGEEGNFVLSKADTELNMKRDVELVLTPFSLDFADHRIQKRLFTELVKSAQNEEMFLETQRIIAELKKYTTCPFAFSSSFIALCSSSLFSIITIATFGR